MSDETTNSGAGERPRCLRCEVPIYLDGDVWRREATGSSSCTRNPAGDGHEPVPATPDADEAHEWPACATYPNLGCVCRGALGQNTTTCTRKRTGDLTPIPAVSAETTDASRRDGSEPEGSGDHSGAGERADHPGADPGDGRTQCATCGKWVWLVTHSCKGVRVYPATPDADDASECRCSPDHAVGFTVHEQSCRFASTGASEPAWMRPIPESMMNEERLDVLLSEFYHSDDGDYVSALGDIHKHVADHASAAATRARAEVGKPMTSAEQNVIAKAFERDRWAGEWNSLPTAIDNLLRDRAARISRGDA